MIEIKNLKKYFPIKGGFFNSKKGDVKAVENITFKIPEGEILGLVGESGSGKTTLGRSVHILILTQNFITRHSSKILKRKIKK